MALLSLQFSFHDQRVAKGWRRGGSGVAKETLVIFDAFVIRMILTAEHLKSASESNKYIKLIIQHEKERLMRVSTSLCNYISIVDANDNQTQKIFTKVKNAIKDNHKKPWVDKNQQGFIATRQKQTCDYNEQLTHSWLKRPVTIPHTEGFMCNSITGNKNESINRQKRTM